MKICSGCKIEKEDNQFSKNRKSKIGLCSRCKQCNKICRDSKKEYYKQYFKDYYQKNKDKIRKSIEEYRLLPENREKINKRNRQRSRSNIQFRLAHNLRTRIGKLITRGCKRGSAVRDLGCTLDEFKRHIENQFDENMSWSNWGSGKDKWNIDHIVPAHAVDLTDREQLLIFCNYRNLRPLWEIDNLQRDYKDVEEHKQKIINEIF